MAFFISHDISTRDAHISPRDEGPRTNMDRGLICHVIWKMPYNNLWLSISLYLFGIILIGYMFYLCPSVRPFVRPSVRPSVLPSFRPSVHPRYFSSQFSQQLSMADDIWSQASYRYAIVWIAFLDPSDFYFLLADLVGFYTH